MLWIVTINKNVVTFMKHFKQHHNSNLKWKLESTNLNLVLIFVFEKPLMLFSIFHFRMVKHFFKLFYIHQWPTLLVNGLFTTKIQHQDLGPFILHDFFLLFSLTLIIFQTWEPSCSNMFMFLSPQLSPL
jgi:hypothetical protein